MGKHAAPEVRRQQILDAALICFAEKGYHETTVDDIVRASSLSKGSIYWHFDTKESIFLGLFDLFNEAIFESWSHVESDHVIDDIRRFGEIALDKLLEVRPLLSAWTEFFRHQTIRRELGKTYTASRKTISKRLKAGIHSGAVRNVDTDHVAALLTAAVEGLLLQAAVDEQFDARAAWPTTFDVIAHGLVPN